MDVVEEADKVKIVAVEGMMRNSKTVVKHFTDIRTRLTTVGFSFLVGHGKIPGVRTGLEPTAVAKPQEHLKILNYVRPAAN